jgi:flavorubredoxin
MGVEAQPMHLRNCHRSDIMTEIFDAKAVIIGSPTLNNGLFPTVADFLTYIKGLKPLNKIGAAFGSYGWSGESVKLINNELKQMNFNLINDGLKIQYIPDDAGLDECFKLGQKIAGAIVKELNS